MSRWKAASRARSMCRGRLEAAGWTTETIKPWLPLLDPQGPAAMDPERIVMVLGEADT